MLIEHVAETIETIRRAAAAVENHRTTLVYYVI